MFRGLFGCVYAFGSLLIMGRSRLRVIISVVLAANVYLLGSAAVLDQVRVGALGGLEMSYIIRCSH